MPQNLTDIEMEEVSLVDDPANPGAKVLFWKNKKGDTMPQQDVKGAKAAILSVLHKFGLYGAPEQAMTFNEIDEGREKLEMIQVLCDSLNSIAGDSEIDDAEKLTLMQQSVNEFLAETAGGSAGAGEGGSAATINNMEDMEMSKIDVSKLNDEEKAELLKALGADTQKDDVQKAKMDEAIQKAVEPLQKQLKDSQEVIAKMKEDEADKARLAKAKELTKGLAGVEPEKVAEMLKGLDEAGQATLEATLKAASESAKLAGVLKEHGSTVTKSGSALEVAKSRAAELRKSNPKLSEAAALSKVWEQDSALYDQHVSEG